MVARSRITAGMGSAVATGQIWYRIGLDIGINCIFGYGGPEPTWDVVVTTGAAFSCMHGLPSQLPPDLSLSLDCFRQSMNTQAGIALNTAHAAIQW